MKIKVNVDLVSNTTERKEEKILSQNKLKGNISVGKPQRRKICPYISFYQQGTIRKITRSILKKTRQLPDLKLLSAFGIMQV